MSPAELLGQMIMVWFGRILRFAGVTIPLFGTLHVMFIIFNDPFLSRHIILTLLLTSLFSFTCCLLTLSKICVLRRKKRAENKSIDLLCDADLKYENETDEVPHYTLSRHFKDIGTTLKNFILKNPVEFCRFRPAYGMFLLTGFVCLFVFAAALTQVKEWNVNDDLYCVALELTVPMVMMISLIYFIANTGFYTVVKDYDVYTPFEQFVHIPMKILVGKTVAIFLTGGGTYSCLTLFIAAIIAFCIVSSNYLYHASEIEGALKSLLPSIFPDARKVLRSVLIVMTVMCVHALIGMVVAAYLEAKRSILVVIERNWQRNLIAISFLLQDTEAETLKDLKTALHHKRTQSLTDEEVTAFNYISWPIWRTKQPFMLGKFETGESSESESFVEQAGDQEAGNVKQPETSEPGQVEPVHIDRPSEAIVDRVIKPVASEQPDKTAMQEALKISEETCTPYLKEPKTYLDLSKLKTLRKH